MNDDNDEDVRGEPCTMCGEPIGDEGWLFEERSDWTDEEQPANVPIHVRCIG